MNGQNGLWVCIWEDGELHEAFANHGECEIEAIFMCISVLCKILFSYLICSAGAHLVS